MNSNRGGVSKIIVAGAPRYCRNPTDGSPNVDIVQIFVHLDMDCFTNCGVANDIAHDIVDGQHHFWLDDEAKVIEEAPEDVWAYSEELLQG
eukprot:g33153.t1